MKRELVGMMRKLSQAGVTHFVVSDKLYADMKRTTKAANKNLGISAPDARLTFHRKPLLRQSDIAHLKVEELV
jgi:hypothetical protein